MVDERRLDVDDVAVVGGSLVEDLLAEGRLEPILSGWTPSPVPLNMLILPERGQLARVRLLIDFLCDQIATLPGLERSVRGD